MAVGTILMRHKAEANAVASIIIVWLPSRTNDRWRSARAHFAQQPNEIKLYKRWGKNM